VRSNRSAGRKRVRITFGISQSSLASADLAKVVSGALAESGRIVPSQILLAGELMKYLLQFRSDVLWSSKKGVALGDRNRAEFSGPGVYVLENILMNMSQMI
jgi:translation initiation factor 1 (eIF-1/SUI1)